MKTACKKNIITDPSALDQLRSCKSVRELEIHLNQMDVACTHEDALHFLRTWEKLDEEREALDFEEMDRVSGGAAGVGDFIKSFLKNGMSFAHNHEREPLTIADVLNRMNQ